MHPMLKSRGLCLCVRGATPLPHERSSTLLRSYSCLPPLCGATCVHAHTYVLAMHPSQTRCCVLLFFMCVESMASTDLTARFVCMTEPHREPPDVHIHNHDQPASPSALQSCASVADMYGAYEYESTPQDFARRTTETMERLKQERARASFAVRQMTHYLDNGEEYTLIKVPGASCVRGVCM